MLLISPTYLRTSSRWQVLLQEGFWMVSDMIADFRFFLKFDRSGHGINFSFLYIVQHKRYSSRTNVIVSSTQSDHFRKQYGRFPTALIISSFYRYGPAIIFFFLNFPVAYQLSTKNASNQPNIGPHHYDRYYSRKDYGWFIIQLPILNFFDKIDRSGHGITFSF